MLMIIGGDVVQHVFAQMAGCLYPRVLHLHLDGSSRDIAKPTCRYNELSFLTRVLIWSARTRQVPFNMASTSRHCMNHREGSARYGDAGIGFSPNPLLESL